MEWIDTHCHLTHPALYRDVTAVSARARAAGVSAMITVATDVTDSNRTIALADHYPGVYATVGVHPHDAARTGEAELQQLRELRHNPRVVAWGEIGLDYFYDFSPPAAQQEVFARQLEMAGRTRLPVVIHCRDAADAVITMLLDHGFRDRKVVFHCFTGTAGEADRIMDCGWSLSFTGILTFKRSAGLRELAARYPLDRLMLETDAPYLAPEPYRNVKPNEPRLLVHTAALLAELKNLPLAELAAVTTANARRFFSMS